MNDFLQTYLYPIVLLILIWYCTTNAKKHMNAAINGFIQQVEDRIQKSGMGPEKKKWVIAQMRAAGYKFNAYMDKRIDDLVDIMNAAKKNNIT